MRLVVAALLLSGARTHPDPVTSIDAVRNGDGTVTVLWTLPADPSVAGVTVERERLDGSGFSSWQLGYVALYWDTSASGSGSYRYWVHTRNAAGELSVGAWIEVWSPGDWDDAHGHFFCWGGVGAAPGVPPWAFLAAAAPLLLAFARRIHERRKI
jgi:hypothetical protein